MDLGIAGKRAFVSGSSAGIGKAIALSLAAEGCSVVVHGRDAARTEETAHAIEAAGGKAFVTLGDLAKEADCTTVARDALAAVGAIDIVVNNCGLVLRKDEPGWSEIPPQTYLDSYEVNFMSTLRMSQHFLPGIRKAGWGRFINISTGGATATPVMVEYGAAKAALNKLTADMAKDVGRYGATCNAVSPGIMKTGATEEWIAVAAKERGCTPEEFERYCATDMWPQAIGRLGTAQDIADMVLFLASPRADYVTGMIVRVDGGIARNVYL